MDQKKILETLQEEIRKSELFYSTYPRKNKIENFIWVGTKDEIIGEWPCHYEFIFEDENRNPKTKNASFLAVEVHLSETNKQDLFKKINKDKQLEFCNWYYGNNEEKENGRIVFKDWKIENKDPKKLIEKAISKLKKLDKLIGTELKAIIIENEELLPNQLTKFTKSSRKIDKQRFLHSREIQEKLITIQHGKWQELLKNQISNKYDETNIEYPLINDYRIDVCGKKGQFYDIYEVKPYESVTKCIREALGQIFFYKFLLEKEGKKVGKLIIAGPGSKLKSDEEYLSIINETSNQMIQYYQIK